MTISAQPQRPMRRRDRELPREEALRAARAAGHAVLSFIHPDTGVPQGVPISPVVTPEGIVYWHSTNEASLKGEGLKKDPRASLTFIAYAEDLPEEYTVDYASTVMTGRAHIVTDPQERRQAMLEICRRYAGADRDATSTEYFDHAGSQIDDSSNGRIYIDMMLKRASLFAVLLCAGIAAAGCASSPKSPAEPADESAQFAPVNYLDICLLENNEVKSPKLVDAIESGFRKAGANVKRLRAGSGPDACSFVVTYEVPNKQGSVNVIRYQTYEHGIPRVDATGSAPQGRALTVQAVEAYSAELLSKLAHKKAGVEGGQSAVPSKE